MWTDIIGPIVGAGVALVIEHLIWPKVKGIVAFLKAKFKID